MLTRWQTMSGPLAVSPRPSDDIAARLSQPRPGGSRQPHQFRTRNDFNKAQRTRSKPNENTAKSTKLSDAPPLITVWLQVRVLPGPPVNQWLSCFHFTACWPPHQKCLASLLPVGASAVRKLLLRLRSGYDFSVRS